VDPGYPSGSSKRIDTTQSYHCRLCFGQSQAFLITSISFPLRCAYSFLLSDYLEQSDTNSAIIQVAKYGKALRGIQELISSRPDRNAVRVSIIASMLIFCFENLQGEMELAVKHAKVALNFTRKHLTPTIRYHSEENAISSVPGLEDEVVDSLIRWDNMVMIIRLLHLLSLYLEILSDLLLQPKHISEELFLLNLPQRDSEIGKC
jgi:hypothetical protein